MFWSFFTCFGAIYHIWSKYRYLFWWSVTCFGTLKKSEPWIFGCSFHQKFWLLGNSVLTRIFIIFKIKWQKPKEKYKFWGRSCGLVGLGHPNLSPLHGFRHQTLLPPPNQLCHEIGILAFATVRINWHCPIKTVAMPWKIILQCKKKKLMNENLRIIILTRRFPL